MATTEHFYTGNNSTTSFAFTFPYLANSDVKVELDNVVKTENSSGQTNNDYTINNTNIVFNSAPGTGVAIHIYRTTNVDTAQAQYAAGSSIRAADLNNNQTQLLYSAQEAGGQKIRQSDLKDSIVNSAKIIDGSIATGDLADDAINGTKIADDSINSEHIVDGSIDLVHMSANSVDSNQYVDGSIDRVHLEADIIDGTKLADNAVNSEHITAGSVDLAHMSANSVDSDQYVDGSIDRVHLEADIIDSTKLADNAVNSEHYVDGSIDLIHMSANSVDSDQYVDGSIDHVHLSNDCIDGDNIQNDVINSEHYAAGSIDHEHLANDIIDGDNIQDDVINTEHYAPNSVDTTALAADAVTGAQIADDSVDSEHIVADSLDTEHYAPTSINSAALASNAVTEAKITDSNVTTNKIADSNVTLGKLHSDLKQTTISNSDTQLPTSGAVVDYVAAQIAPLGGLEVIATEVAFPNTQPASGVVISISDAGGVVFNGSGVSTTGRTVGGSTVTINGAPSSLYSETLAAGVGLMVSSTGSSQTYNYHKILGKEDDIKQLSDDINDFNARYRVGSANPTSALDAGDLFFNTSTQKLLVYNSTNSAWEEAQSVGNFYIATFSESFDGSRTAFTVSNAPTNAQQLIISINGVIQKPNSGTGQPSEGFTLSGSTVTFSSAVPSGSDYFAIVLGSTVNIGTPSDGTITAAKITSGAVETAKIADGAVTEVKLGVSNSPTNGYFLSAQSGNTGGLTWAQVSTDLVADTSPQLGGDLDTNSHHILFDDSHAAKFGDGNDLQIYHNGNSIIENENNSCDFRVISDSIELKGRSADEMMLKGTVNGAVELYHDNSLKFETTASGTRTTGAVHVNDGSASGNRLSVGNGGDLKIYHTNPGSYIDDDSSALSISSQRIDLVSDDGENMARFYKDAQVELYHNNTKMLSTESRGAILQKADACTFIIGSTNAGSAQLFLDGDSNGDGNGGDYSGIRHNSAGHLEVFADNPSTNASIYFKTGNATNRALIDGDGHFYPYDNNTYDLGTSSYRWRNVYTNDLHLSNEGGANDVDSTWGNWTIQEGESDLFLKNNRSGKKYKFNLTEVS